LKYIEDLIKEYYSLKAIEYDTTYRPRERKCDMAQITGLVSNLFNKKEVLEIACGTGYWTQLIAERSKSILATDCSDEMLTIAKTKCYGKCRIEFKKLDAFDLSGISKCYTGGFCGFWWSHIPKSKRKNFHYNFHSKLRKNAKVVIVDNNYVEGINGPRIAIDEDGNTYQHRFLRSGSSYTMLKNFPSNKELKHFFGRFGIDVQIVNLQHYWLVTYNNPR